MLAISCLLAMIATSLAQTPLDLPVTFYLKELEQADTDNANIKYYYATLCSQGIANEKQAVLQIYVSGNVNWNTTAKPFVVVQVSVCQNDYSPQCVIATNYQWGATVKAIPNISWALQSNETAYYIRAMAGYAPTEFSMELSFTSGDDLVSYPWSTDVPFMTQTPNNQYEALEQYWKSNEEYNVANEAFRYFAVAYCNQGKTVTGIDVSIAAPPSITDYSLMQQWGCPQGVLISQCTPTNSLIVGWNNPKIASFNLLQYQDTASLSTQNGIWIGVSGYGANEDQENYFSLYATTIN
jgi:hypothetical protein